MSTTPDGAAQDAGLERPGPGAVVHLAQQDAVEPDALDEGEYQPDEPRPDRDGAADEADVVEQADEVPGYDEDEPGA